MALTRSFKDTVRARALRDSKFRSSLLTESLECMLSGDMPTGKAILRDYINATVGFEELGFLINKQPKSIMRMVSLNGNPTATNLFGIIHTLLEKEGFSLEVKTIHHDEHGKVYAA